MNKKALTKSLLYSLKTIGCLTMITALLLSCIVLLSVNSCTASRQIENYKRYYKASETLLDSLESAYGWLDGYDPGEAYDEYCRARKLVKP